MAKLGITALACGMALSAPALAQGVLFDGASFVYTPGPLTHEAASFGSFTFSFRNIDPGGMGVYWGGTGNDPIILWLVDIGPDENGTTQVRPVLNLSDNNGASFFSTSGPVIKVDGYQHVVGIAYDMRVILGNFVYKMTYLVDGQTFYWGNPNISVNSRPAYPFAPYNGGAVYVGWPGSGELGGVNYNPGDFYAQFGAMNPYNAPAVMLHGRSDNWLNQDGTDVPFYISGALVDIEDITINP